jgi:hypothetical protein
LPGTLVFCFLLGYSLPWVFGDGAPRVSYVIGSIR